MAKCKLSMVLYIPIVTSLLNFMKIQLDQKQFLFFFIPNAIALHNINRQ
jgi:hypothetical protein